ncbi:MAG: (2Fe-2S)-binding protein, partial [Oscillospiraceae bacterium]|nr:(2Fe-2S)-binding protein [Oscillospiraceae bacterium]
MEAKMINLKINKLPVSVPEGTTILQAAREAHIDIPTLCYLKDINEIGACRMCVVEIKGSPKLNAACVFPVSEGMEVVTNSKRVFDARKTNLQLLLSNHRRECLSCVRSGSCELQKLCKDYGVDDEGVYDGAVTPSTLDESATHMVRDNAKCILCRRCTAVCDKLQDAAVIGVNKRGFDTHIGSAFDAPLNSVACVSCGQCIVACPTGALREKDQTDEVWAALADPEKRVIVQTAPSIRATLGEEFGLPIGTNVEGKMAAALLLSAVASVAGLFGPKI